MSLHQKPFETSYPRWRHLVHGYVVKILAIQNYRGENGYYSTIIVEGSRRNPKTKVSWSGEIFRKHFEPIGRKKKAKSAIERVLEDKGD